MFKLTLAVTLLSAAMTFAQASSILKVSTSGEEVNSSFEISVKSKTNSTKEQVNILAIDWDILAQLVNNDPNLSISSKTSFNSLLDIADPIQRDEAMQRAPYYQYLSDILYPKAIRTSR